MAEKVRKTPEQTRQSLLDAGLLLFGRDGYKNVTTRALAEEAGVNQAAIPYHFGCKKGLYIAVAEAIAGDVEIQIVSIVEALKEELEDAGSDKKKLGNVVTVYIHLFLNNILSTNENMSRFQFVNQEYMRPSDGFDIIYARAISRVHKFITALAAQCLGLPKESDAAKLCANSFMGMMVIYVFGRPVVQKRMGWDEYTPERINMVIDAVTELALNMLCLNDAARG